MTFPKRTAMNCVAPLGMDSMYSSTVRLLAPMTLVGRTALSVETNTKRSTPHWAARSMVI